MIQIWPHVKFFSPFPPGCVALATALCGDWPASSLDVSLGKALNEIVCNFELVGIGGSLIRRPKRSLRCLLVEVP